jgi:hypothetical protein
VWFIHAKCDVCTHECDYDTHESDYDTHTWQNHTLRVEITLVCDVHTHNVVNTGTSVISEHKVWFLNSKCDFNTHECDLYTQSVIFKRSLILTRTKVITPLTTVISTRSRVISTHIVWCWHVWVWLWHSQKILWHLCVSKPHSACRNHSFVWCSHAYCDEHMHECNFLTQSVISTRRVWLAHA